MKVLGLPDVKFLEKASRRTYFFGKTTFNNNLMTKTGIITEIVNLFTCVPIHADSKGLPRSITNSRGRKRRPNAKDLITAVRSNDKNFIKFLSRCLE